MILALKTATGVAEIRLLSDNGRVLAEEDWPADRRMADGLLGHIQTLLARKKTKLDKLNGLVVYRGPGSFTGLRIGITVMNTLSYSLNLPIVGQTEHDWQRRGAKRLRDGANDQLVLPEYDAEARITQPKK